MKVRKLASRIDVKTALKLKRFQEKRTPCTIVHHIHCEDGSCFECRLDFIGGYSEQAAIDGVNTALSKVEGAVVEVKIHAILPLQDKPQDGEYELLQPTRITDNIEHSGN